MRLYHYFSLVFWAILSLAANAAQGEFVKTEYANTRFVIAQNDVIGNLFEISIHQELADHWHVYWENPGDSGLPLEVKWKLPEGAKVTEPRYPTPHRLPLGPLMNYGFEHEVVYSFMISLPDGYAEEQIDISADVTWLICKDVCIPESATISISIPVMPNTRDSQMRDMDGDVTSLYATQNWVKMSPNAQAIYFELNEKQVGFKFDQDLSARQLGPGTDINADYYFFPQTMGAFLAAVPQETHIVDGELYLILEKDFEFDAEADYAGVLTFTAGEKYRGLDYKAKKSETPAAFAEYWQALNTPEFNLPEGLEQNQDMGDVLVLLFAFLGGVILNIMPCVFPVVFIKAASLARSAHESPATVRLHGLLYTAGVLLCFMVIAGALLALRAGGEQVGWGFHLQSPLAVSAFAAVILLIGLNMAGVFEIGTSLQGIGSDQANQGGNSGAFFTGLLAVAVAAPCIGPLLGVPIGVALDPQRPAWFGMLIFMLVGLGLALPYLLLSFIPALGKLLPKPGAWMETFKQLLSFAMFATAIWLVWTLTKQAGVDGMLLLLIGLLFISFAAWCFGKSQMASGLGKIIWIIFAIVTLGASIWFIKDIESRPVEIVETVGNGDTTKLPTVAYSTEKLAAYRAEGQSVFIDFTAAWCVTCQVNKQTVLTRAPVVAKFHEKDVIYMVADWTNQDAEITKALENFDRAGVPLYVFYPPHGEAIVLPQMLSIDMMIELFDQL